MEVLRSLSLSNSAERAACNNEPESPGAAAGPVATPAGRARLATLAVRLRGCLVCSPGARGKVMMHGLMNQSVPERPVVVRSGHNLAFPPLPSDEGCRPAGGMPGACVQRSSGRGAVYSTTDGAAARRRQLLGWELQGEPWPWGRGAYSWAAANAACAGCVHQLSVHSKLLASADRERRPACRP